MWIGLHEEIRKLTFRSLALRRSELNMSRENMDQRNVVTTGLTTEVNLFNNHISPIIVSKTVLKNHAVTFL